MAIRKKMRWLIIGVALAAVIVFSPFAFMLSNLGAAVLDAVLNRKPTLAELLGTYRLRANWGEATLRINADGTFEEVVTEAGKGAKTVSGKWQSHDDSNFRDVDFKPFGMVWDEDHDRETNIYGINFYKPHFGMTYGMINDDLDEKFVRQQGDNNGK